MSLRLTGPAFILLLTLSLGVGANPQSFIFSHVVRPDTPKGKMAAMLKSIVESMKSRGIIGFGYLHNGLRQLSANKPFKLPSDLERLSFRIMGSDVLDKQFRTIGAIPVPMTSWIRLISHKGENLSSR